MTISDEEIERIRKLLPQARYYCDCEWGHAEGSDAKAAADCVNALPALLDEIVRLRADNVERGLLLDQMQAHIKTLDSRNAQLTKANREMYEAACPVDLGKLPDRVFLKSWKDLSVEVEKLRGQIEDLTLYVDILKAQEIENKLEIETLKKELSIKEMIIEDLCTK